MSAGSKTQGAAADRFHDGRGGFTRREFMAAAGLTSAAALAAESRAQEPPGKPGRSDIEAIPGAIPLRPFGKTGVQVSALAMGGHHIGGLRSADEAIGLVQQALDAGIAFFDNCWEYWNGRAEDWLGRALKGGRRDKVFLMTKVCTHGRDSDLAMQMLDQSLRRLQTDHLDLWQIHGMAFENDPELAYADDGVIQALDLAKKVGKTRFVGFTGHKDPAVHLEMLRRGFPFDAVQMPLNPFDAGFRSFERLVLPELRSRGIAVLGMKPLGGTAAAVKSGLVTAQEMLRYAMSLPVTTTICGMDSMDVLVQNLRIARNFKPMSPAEMQALRDRCAQAAGDGRYELYKLSLKFDDPQARMPHEYPLDLEQQEVKDMLFKEAGSP